MTEADGSLLRAVTHWHRPWGWRRAVGIGVVAAAIAAGTAFVYATGGIKYVFSHSLYVPILLAGALFGPVGGVVAGLSAGLALGPWMPIDVAVGEMQEPLNWLYRSGFFALIGAVTGLLVVTVARLSGRDPVSGAPSQVPLWHDLGRLIDRQKRGELDGFSLLLLKLENHAEVASTFGPETGTALLRRFVERLEQAIGGESRAGTTSDDLARLYHLHGESFGVVVPGGHVHDLRDRIREQVREPVLANGVPVFLQLVVGRADCPDHSQTASSLVQHAAAAAEIARSSRGSDAIYDVRLDHENRHNLLLLSRLASAIESNQLCLHYQPKLELLDGSVSGLEALVRWQHPDHGLLLPGRFVPQAETTHLIRELAAWVLRAALSDARDLRDQGNEWCVAVNLSARNLHDPQLLTRIDDALEVTGSSPHHLEIEVTESAVLRDREQAKQVLWELRDRGIGVAIDDFGAGTTSLGYLKHLPASSLKIDRAFVQHLAEDPADQHIVGSIVAMAHKLGMEVVAEGVEDGATLRMATELGCDAAQGFLISTPQPVTELKGFRYELA